MLDGMVSGSTQPIRSLGFRSFRIVLPKSPTLLPIAPWNQTHRNGPISPDTVQNG